MNRGFRSLAGGVVLVLLCASRVWTIEHLGMSDADRFTLCAQGVFGKPVVVNNQLAQLGHIPCPASREQIVQVSESEQYRHWLFENERWVAFMWTSQIDHPQPWFRRRLDVKETVNQLKEYGDVPGSRWFTADEVKQIQDAVRRQVRTTPNGVIREGFLTYTAEIGVRLLLDCHRLRKDRESIVGAWDSRLIYGEKTAKGFELLWDSPVLPFERATIEYNDMDGDGVEEILVYSKFGRYDAGRFNVALTIFNTKGQELSRQDDDCLIPAGSDATEEGAGCPIVGLDATFERQPDGRKDIVLQRGAGEGEVKIERYRLIGGRYVTHDRPTVTSVLLAALRNADRSTRWAAAKQLGDRGPAKATPVVAQALTNVLGDEDLDVRIVAAEALGKLGSMAQVALPALKKAVAAQNQYLRAAAAEAIKKIEGAASSPQPSPTPTATPPV